MIETPEIAETTRKLTAIVPIRTPREKMGEVMGPGVEELFGTLAAQRIEPVGPWFTHHLEITPEEFNFEICIETATEVTPAGRVKPGEWPAMKVVRTVYHGPYEGLGEAWGEFDPATAALGLKTATDLWEVYVVNPATTSDPAEFRTQLNRQVLE
ncbi:MAG: AraC family transcriptional regulator [Akkermansiaceae bacterium]|nr:AraC family transcriptional regulator [Akkermansiaceae bacterium]